MMKKVDFQNRAISAFIFFFLLVSTAVISFACAGTPLKPDLPALTCAAVDASELECTMKGAWDGVEQVSGGSVSGAFEINILANGTITGCYSGNLSGTISGCVDSRGKFNARGFGSGPDISWSGQIKKSGADILGSGEWVATALAKGTWSGNSCGF